MSHAATPSKMTLPTQRSPFPNSADLDVNSIMNNREFQEMLQEYFQNNSMTLDEFLEHLPRFMMENYGAGDDEDAEYDNDNNENDNDDNDNDDNDNDDNDEDYFISFLRQSAGHRAESVNTSEVLMRSLLAGRREIHEIPLRTILPQSPPPSPTPNLATTGPSFFQRNLHREPIIPFIPHAFRRPSQLRNSTSSFDPNGSDKSPCTSPSLIGDRNNNTGYVELPLTSEFMRRYRHGRIHTGRLNEDAPER